MVCSRYWQCSPHGEHGLFNERTSTIRPTRQGAREGAGKGAIGRADPAHQSDAQRRPESRRCTRAQDEGGREATMGPRGEGSASRAIRRRSPGAAGPRADPGRVRRVCCGALAVRFGPLGRDSRPGRGGLPRPLRQLPPGLGVPVHRADRIFQRVRAHGTPRVVVHPRRRTRAARTSRPRASEADLDDPRPGGRSVPGSERRAGAPGREAARGAGVPPSQRRRTRAEGPGQASGRVGQGVSLRTEQARRGTTARCVFPSCRSGWSW